MGATAHRCRWYGIAGSERIPRNRHMRGRDWGWDAECSCGWRTRTGGAIEARIREAIEDHRREADQATPEFRTCTACGDEWPVETEPCS